MMIAGRAGIVSDKRRSALCTSLYVRQRYACKGQHHEEKWKKAAHVRGEILAQH
jgi:hypothetical protein